MNEAEKILLAKAKEFNITNPLEQAHLLAQCSHESADFKQLVENLNYSPQGLLRTWPTRFTPELANQIGRTVNHPANQKAIANIAYNGRMGNLPNTDDGYNFRGRGFNHLTGRDNYTKFNQWLKLYNIKTDIVINPDYLMIDLNIAALAAIWFWTVKKISQYALKNDYLQVTKLINGGTLGLEERTKLTKYYDDLLK